MRSAVPTVPGVPWWGAFAIAVGTTLVGVLIDGMRGEELTSAFTAFYVLGCIAAAVAVRYSGLFTAMAQPPLLLLAAVPLGQELVASGSTNGLKDLALNVAYPLVNRFPAMLLATLAVLAIGGVRIYLVRRTTGVRTRAPRERTGSKARTGRSRAASTPKSPSTQKSPTGAERRRRATAEAAPAAASRVGNEARASRAKTSVRDVTDPRATPTARRRSAAAGRPAEPAPRREPDGRPTGFAPPPDDHHEPRKRPSGPGARAGRPVAQPSAAQPSAMQTAAAPRPQATRTQAYMPPVRYRDRHED